MKMGIKCIECLFVNRHAPIASQDPNTYKYGSGKRKTVMTDLELQTEVCAKQVERRGIFPMIDFNYRHI